MLIFFNLTSPLVVSCFTGNLVMSIITSILVTAGFSSLWLVAQGAARPPGSARICSDSCEASKRAVR